MIPNSSKDKGCTSHHIMSNVSMKDNLSTLRTKNNIIYNTFEKDNHIISDISLVQTKTLDSRLQFLVH